MDRRSAEDPPGEDLMETVLAVLDEAEVPVALLDRSGGVLETNAAFAHACGRPTGELEDHPLTAWVLSDDAAAVEAIVGELLDGATSRAAVHGTDARLVGADGRVRPMRLHFGVIGGSGDTALLCVLHDRSSERRRERSERGARLAEVTAGARDATTGLPNRKGLEIAIGSAARRSRANDVPYALLRCEVTDAGGWPAAGALAGCIERIRQRLRPADTIAVLPGEALVVLAEDLHDEQDAAGVAYRVLSTVVEPLPADEEPVTVRMVLGVAMADAATPPHALLAASAEAAADARDPGGFRLMDLRGLEG